VALPALVLGEEYRQRFCKSGFVGAGSERAISIGGLERGL
jgi:hypothetical protein